MSRFFSARIVAVAAAIVLVGSAGVFAAGEASAGAAPAVNQPPGLDHFLCYAAQPTKGFTIPGNLLLQNQFNTKGFVPKVSQKPLQHCNPAQKTVGKKVYPISNPDAHLLCFPITAGVQPTPIVKVTNQFGTADLATGQPTRLCLPTWTNVSAPPNMQPNQPPKLDHFVCYPVKYADTTTFTIPPRVLVSDQFSPAGPVRVTVGAPTELCLPTTKTANGVVYRAANPKAHLLCFAVSKTPTVPRLFDENQFGTDQIRITPPTTSLCLPSFKTVIG